MHLLKKENTAPGNGTPSGPEKRSTMSSNLIKVEEYGKNIGVITLNRPDQKNAVNIELLEALCDTLDQLRVGKRVLILRGSGSDFCAGLDLKEILDEEKAPHALELMAGAIQKIMSAPCITISAVQGSALAGGAALMLACDFSIVADDAKIGFPEVRRGLVPTMPLTFLRRKVSEQKARELILTGEPISGLEAARIDLVSRSAPVEEIFDEANSLADVILRNAPGALRQSKVLLDELWHLPVDSHLERCARIHRRVRTSAEAHEGFRAFQEKREPSWDQHVVNDDHRF
jgi:methylglutaconyl-CoA hydratase